MCCGRECLPRCMQQLRHSSRRPSASSAGTWPGHGPNEFKSYGTSRRLLLTYLLQTGCSGKTHVLPISQTIVTGRFFAGEAAEGAPDNSSLVSDEETGRVARRRNVSESGDPVTSITVSCCMMQAGWTRVGQEQWQSSLLDRTFSTRFAWPSSPHEERKSAKELKERRPEFCLVGPRRGACSPPKRTWMQDAAN